MLYDAVAEGFLIEEMDFGSLKYTWYKSKSVPPFIQNTRIVILKNVFLHVLRIF